MSDNRNTFNRPTTEINWACKRFTSAGTLVPASVKHEEHRAKSAYRRWFLDIFGGDWQLDVLKYKDNDLKVMADHLKNSSLSFIHDDSLTVCKTVSTLPLRIEQSIGKTDKRLSRLLGETMFGALLSLAAEGFNVRTLELTPAGEAAFDGLFAKAGKAVFEAIVNFTLEGLEGRPNKIVRRHAHDLRNRLNRGEKVRVYATTLTTDGEGKGHLLFDPALPDNEIVFVDVKKEVAFTEGYQGGLFIAFNELHASPLWLDVQTIAMHGQDGRYTGAIDGARQYFSDLLNGIKSGKFDARMASAFKRGFNDRGVDVADEWWLAEYAYSGGHAGWFTTTARAAIDTVVKQAIKQHGGRRIPVAGESRRYICTDYSYGTSVPRGENEVHGESLVVNVVDWITRDDRFQTLHDLNVYVEQGGKLSDLPTGIGAILGGADMDDLVVIHPYINAEGGCNVQITRSPTFVGEIVEYGQSGIVWPEDLPPMQGIDPTGRMNIQGRDWKSMIGAIKTLIDLGSVVGCAAKDSRYSILTLGHLPDGMLAPMSTIVDETVQFFNTKASEVRKFHIAHSQWLAEQSAHGVVIPRYVANELMESVDVDAISVADKDQTDYPGYWFDHLMDQYSDVLNKFLADASDLLCNVYPPAEFMQAAKKYEASAKLYRQFYGQLFEERREEAVLHFGDEDVRVVQSEEDLLEEKAFFQGIARACEGFLNEYPEAERPGIVAASVAIAFGKSAGDEPVKDFCGWMRASGDESGVFDYMMTFLRETGLLGLPMAEPTASGKPRLVCEDVSVERATFHVPMFNSWAYMNDLDPRSAKPRREELLAGDYQARMVGLTFRLAAEQILVKGSRATRFVALGSDGVIGSLPQGFEAEGLPPVIKIMSTFEYDGKLVAICEDAVL
jgi:hypothetical protein